MSVVTVTIGDDSFEARFQDDLAPLTCARFRAMLPWSGQLIHVRWSGEGCWVPLGNLELGVPSEMPTHRPQPGQLLLYPGGVSEAELLLAYGEVAFACKAGPLAGNPFLIIIGDLDRLAAVGREILWSGTGGLQISRSFAGHRITAAVEHEAEEFGARDVSSGGATNQDRSRDLWAFVGEWRADWTNSLTTNFAIRHDSFSDFADATTLRASVLFRPARGWTLHAAYGEGIARPTFYDLYGFFPGSFVGNPNLRPERSAGWEAGARWQNGQASVSVTGFSATLEQEIVDVFGAGSSTTANASGESRRRGVEFHAGYRVGHALNLALNYTYLEADEGKVAGAALVSETRRPHHSANFVADGRLGAFSWGATVAYVGERTDIDYDLFQRVTLGDHVLASATLAYEISPLLELYGRIENAFHADYQDVAGYNTPGRTVYAGIRLRLGR